MHVIIIHFRERQGVNKTERMAARFETWKQNGFLHFSPLLTLQGYLSNKITRIQNSEARYLGGLGVDGA